MKRFKTNIFRLLLIWGFKMIKVTIEKTNEYFIIRFRGSSKKTENLRQLLVNEIKDNETISDDIKKNLIIIFTAGSENFYVETIKEYFWGRRFKSAWGTYLTNPQIKKAVLDILPPRLRTEFFCGTKGWFDDQPIIIL